MFGEQKQRWMELCELASEEQDPKKLVALIAEIDRLLEEKKQRVAMAPGLVAENPIKRPPSTINPVEH
ncbi:MAG TPA: hypothetical protein VN948_24050 [Terriglobales bacterium]|nr:hypothetical protein [Terriglobales bacterium]